MRSNVLKRTIRKRFVTACAALLVWVTAYAQTEELPSPSLKKRHIAFETSSGTWMTVDVSPDGQTILFDLVGHIYELPIAGGHAIPITRGWEWHRAPRYSPDGTQIAMVRDGPGADEVWIMPTHGGVARRLTDHSFKRTGWVRGSPTWYPDGQSILYGTDAFSHIADLRRVTVRDGAVMTLEANASKQHRRSGIISSDGKILYVTEQWDRPIASLKVTDPPSLVVLVRVELMTGKRTVLTDTHMELHEFTPQMSDDGRWLSYVRRDRNGRSALRIRELDRNANELPSSDRELLYLPDEDDPYRFDDTDARPAYSFTPDGTHVLIGAGGKLHKVEIATARSEIISFTAPVNRPMASAARPRIHLPDGPFQAREIQWPRLTPDGKTLVFSALGYLWKQQLPGGKPQRLTSASESSFELMPALSPNGKTIAYIALDRAGRSVTPGRLMTVPLAGGPSQIILSGEATILAPSWSPHADKLAFVQEAGDKSAFGWVALSDKRVHLALPVQRGYWDSWERLVSFAPDGNSLWCSWEHAPSGLPEGTKMVEASLDGRTTTPMAFAGLDSRGMVSSPDRRYALLRGDDTDLWLFELSKDKAEVSVDFSSDRLRRITSTGAEFVSWESDRTFIYSYGNKIYRYTIGGNGPKHIHTVLLTHPRHQGKGVIAFVNGRIVTMNGHHGAGEVYEKGTLVIRERRIAAVGARDNVTIPKNARVFDATGLTLLPALSDTHYHPDMGVLNSGLDHADTLANGITTVWLASQPPWNRGFMPINELREIGRIEGPRWNIAYRSINGVHGDSAPQLLSAYSDALRLARRRADLGATVMKEYLTRRRDQRRWFAQAARDTNLGIVAHGQGIEQVLSRAADGYTGFDHTPFAVPVYDDVRQFLARAGVIWTPNFLVTAYGTEPSEVQFERQAYLQELLKHWPDQRVKWNQHYSNLPLTSDTSSSEPSHPTRLHRVANAAVYLMSGGVKIGASAHNPPALFTHSELWYLQQAGASPPDVLRTATVNNAEKMGLDQDLGSLESGKIADILVLKGNPLEDVIHTAAQKYVVADGNVYEVDVTLQ